MFGRATIRLGIGPHSSWFRFSLDLGLLFVFFGHFVLILFTSVVLDLVNFVSSGIQNLNQLMGT